MTRKLGKDKNKVHLDDDNTNARQYKIWEQVQGKYVEATRNKRMPEQLQGDGTH